MTNVIIINAKEKTKTEVQITNQDLTEYLKKELGENFCYGHSNGNNETLYVENRDVNHQSPDDDLFILRGAPAFQGKGVFVGRESGNEETGFIFIDEINTERVQLKFLKRADLAQYREQL